MFTASAIPVWRQGAIRRGAPPEGAMLVFLRRLRATRRM
jgi:hypothetical protein